MSIWTQSRENVWVAAHRGFSEKYPENTMEAFKAAVELGVDQIETDVRITADGELVLHHDATVDRTTNGTGKVKDFTLAQLRELDAGIKKGEEFAGYKIPTFVEFMDWMKTLPETMTIDIELKEYTNEDEALSYAVTDRVLKMVDEYGFTDRIVINSFDGKLNEYIANKYGNKYRQHVFMPISKLRNQFERNPYTFAYCACVYGFEMADYNFLRNYNCQPWVGASVRDEERIDKAVECGAVLITCNNVDEVLEILRKKGLHK